MELIFTTGRYKKFLIEFRRSDVANAATEGEMVVEYGNYKYYYKAPNFRLIAYNVDGVRRTLTNYNHVGLSRAKSLEGLKADFRTGGGGSTQMNSALSAVVAATSEAARSKVVESAFQRMISGASIDLHTYEVLFKAYNQPARFNGFLGQDGGYKSSWRALKKQDYLHFFNSAEYTGDSAAMRTAVSGL